MEEITRGTDRLAVIIMPRDVGPGPHTPRGHAAALTRAEIVAEWRDGKFEIIKRKNP